MSGGPRSVSGMSTDVATPAPEAGLVDVIASLETFEDDVVLDALLGLQRAQARIAWAQRTRFATR